MHEYELKLNDSGVEAIVEFSTPKIIRAMKRASVMANWFRSFIETYFVMVLPLSELLKGNPAKLLRKEAAMKIDRGYF